MSVDLTKFGAIKVTPVGADPNDPNPDIHQFNFGVAGRPGLAGPPPLMNSAPALYEIAPHLQGRYDWTQTICHPEIARKVLGSPLKAQMQPRGTCGGRCGSRSTENEQVLLMAAGQQATFKEVSHAYYYFLARREYGMLGSGDGVPDGSIPIVGAKYGVLNREESGDIISAGQRADDLAVKWGGRGGAPQNLAQLAIDNLIKHTPKLRNHQEVADALSGGAAIMASSSSGFSMTRDSDGMCKRQGTWYHYYVLNGVGITKSGRKFFSYEQSWGDDVPGGPLLMDGMFPGHCFGITPEAVDEMCREGSVNAVVAFDLWDPKQVLEIDWNKYF